MWIWWKAKEKNYFTSFYEVKSFQFHCWRMKINWVKRSAMTQCFFFQLESIVEYISVVHCSFMHIFQVLQLFICGNYKRNGNFSNECAGLKAFMRLMKQLPYKKYHSFFVTLFTIKKILNNSIPLFYLMDYISNNGYFQSNIMSFHSF